MGAKYGQHFLRDKNLLSCFLKVCNYSKKDLLIEIGSGKGILTEIFVGKVKKIIAVEIDPNLASYLRKKFSTYKSVFLLHQDALKVNFRELVSNKDCFENIDVVGNLPYYLATKLLLKLFFNYYSFFRSFTFMFQREVGERITAQPKTKSYSYLSVVTQFFSDIKVIKVISPEMFFPKPKVSGIVLFFKLKTCFLVEEKDFFLYFFFLKVVFLGKRKTLNNNLKLFYFKQNTFNLVKHFFTKRAEELSQRELVFLFFPLKKEFYINIFFFYFFSYQVKLLKKKKNNNN